MQFLQPPRQLGPPEADANRAVTNCLKQILLMEYLTKK